MSTERQLEANRLNAQKSTGPRSAEGKAVSRMNALQSGVFAETVIIPHEDPEAFKTLQQALTNEHCPVSETERALVDAITLAIWMLRRFQRAEQEHAIAEYQRLCKFSSFDRQHPLTDLNLGSDHFLRILRRTTAAERSLHRTLDQLRRLRKDRQAAEALEPAAQPEETPAVTEEIGFVPSPAPEASLPPSPAASHAPETASSNPQTPPAVPELRPAAPETRCA